MLERLRPNRDNLHVYAIVMCALLVGVHVFALLEVLSAGRIAVWRDASAEVISGYAKVLGGTVPDPTTQSRVLVPLLLTAILWVVRSAKFTVLLFETGCAALLLTAAYWWGRGLPRALRLGLVPTVALISLSSLKDVGRLGDTLGYALPIVGIALLERVADGDARWEGWRGWAALAGLCALTAAARFDCALALVAIWAARGVLGRDRRLTLMTAAGLGAAVAVFVLIDLRYPAASGYLRETLMGGTGGTPRALQVLHAGNWALWLPFMGMLAATPLITWRRSGLTERCALAVMGLYGLVFFFAGNMSEYRSWVPVAVVLVVIAFRHIAAPALAGPGAEG